MAEYIDRKSLIDEFDRLGLGEHSFVERVFSDGVRTIIAGIPAADVAPVVRCKDCIYTRKLYGGLVCKCEYGICSGCFLREDFFCANGTRKETRKDGDSNALD